MCVCCFHSPISTQTPSTGLRHTSSNHSHTWLCHRSRKTVSKFVTDSSYYIRRLFYSSPRCLRQHKYNQNRLNRDRDDDVELNVFGCRVDILGTN